MHFETLAIHDGQTLDRACSVTVPIYQTSIFGREILDKRREFFYSIEPLR